MKATPQIAADGSRLRLNTTIRLRWFAVAGQAATVFVVYRWLGFPLPLGWCVTVILMSALLNIVLSLTNPSSQLLRSRHAMLFLSYDILELAALLYLTGGLENPFFFLLVVPVAVSASTQPLAVTLSLTLLGIALATLLVQYHQPLPWASVQPPVLPHIYVAGLWTALVSCIVFIAIYAWRIGQEARQMSQALTAADLVLAREQRLSALDGLAAAAAHKLGTPLSTIALVAKELEREVPAQSPLREDIVLLQTQAARCRDILSELSKSGGKAKTIISHKSRLATSSRKWLRRCACPASRSTWRLPTVLRRRPNRRWNRSFRAIRGSFTASITWSRTLSISHTSASRSMPATTRRRSASVSSTTAPVSSRTSSATWASLTSHRGRAALAGMKNTEWASVSSSQRPFLSGRAPLSGLQTAHPISAAR